MVKNLQLSIFIISFLSFLNNGFAKDVILVADDWCPYNCLPTDKDPGYMIEIVIESFKLFGNGEKVVYKLMPWPRAVKEVRSKRVDGLVAAVESDAVGLHKPEPHQGMWVSNIFTHPETTWKYKDVFQLKNSKKRVGVIKGYDYGPEFMKFITENPKQVFISHGDKPLTVLINSLKMRRLELLVEDKFVFWYNVKMRKIPKKTFKSVGVVGKFQKLYIAFHNKKYSDIVAKGMVALRKSGKLKEILAKYNLKDWAPDKK